MDADREAERGGLPGPSIFIGWGQCLALTPRHDVELQGVEPWSSQADPRLSTCLSIP